MGTKTPVAKSFLYTSKFWPQALAAHVVPGLKSPLGQPGSLVSAQLSKSTPVQHAPVKHAFG
jgi:hypothetical protein